MKYLLVGAAAALTMIAVGCSSAPEAPDGASASAPLDLVALCGYVHSLASAGTPPSATADVCAGTRTTDLSQLPPALAGAGCTTLGTYQLGQLEKSARYAFCPSHWGVHYDPLRHMYLPNVDNPVVTAFVAAYHAADDDDPNRPYGYASTATSMCDACLMGLPSGMQFVFWHQQSVCFGDSQNLDAVLATELPPISNPAPRGVCQPGTTCVGGCMVRGAPPGIPQ